MQVVGLQLLGTSNPYRRALVVSLSSMWDCQYYMVVVLYVHCSCWIVLSCCMCMCLSIVRIFVLLCLLYVLLFVFVSVYRIFVGLYVDCCGLSFYIYVCLYVRIL